MDSINDQTGVTWKLSSERMVSFGHPFLVGILNVTPDSFFDGGELGTVELVVERARVMVDEGGDMLDIGGESTRPGAQRIGVEEQIRRVVPMIEGIRSAGIDVPISIDTTQRAVAKAALDAGADVINDVSAGDEDSGMFALASERGCGLILMHRAALPEQDRYSDEYLVGVAAGGEPIAGDVVGCVVSALSESRDTAIAAGVDEACIVLDPGLGFGKGVEQNLELIRSTRVLIELGRPVMSALSRKSFVGRVSLGRDSEPSERLAGTLALSVMHVQAGARLFRVHDVGAHRQALDAAWALMGTRGI